MDGGRVMGWTQKIICTLVIVFFLEEHEIQPLPQPFDHPHRGKQADPPLLAPSEDTEHLLCVSHWDAVHHRATRFHLSSGL